MSNLYWAVPVHLDALFLQTDQAGPGPMADFSQQPWSDGTNDYNSSIPFTSEELLAKPFQDSDFTLKAGVHLHWALPDSLTRIFVDGTNNYVPVPDRWLIARTGGTSSAGVNYQDQQWIVESSYLFPAGSDASTGAITIPFQDTGGPPFRYMGRDMQLSAWPGTTGNTYLQPLTAVGYGEPTFAAFYPNCHSVFGFYDGEADAVGGDLCYTVIGYYVNTTTDAFGSFIQKVLKQNPQAPASELLTAVNDFFAWTTGDSTANGFPALMLCYAQLTFDPVQADGPTLQEVANDAQITIGQSGAEALSARLAFLIDPTYKNLLEDQLEALQMKDYLGSKRLDIGPNFREQRHTNGFTGVQSGVSWSIVSNSDMTQADAEQSQDAAELLLPPELADALNKLNVLQQQYDSNWQNIIGRQRQLFMDWYKYQQVTHPPQDMLQAYPQPSLIRFFLERSSIPGVTQLVLQTGVLDYIKDSSGNIIGASPGDEDDIPDTPGTLSWQLALAVNALISQLALLNTTTPVTAAGVTFILQGHGAPRFWVANDPVVMVNGTIAQPTDRHGQDYLFGENGLLPCHIVSIDGDVIDNSSGTNVINADLLAAIVTWQGDNIGFETWTVQPWNPFMLEWMAEVQPLQNGSNVANDNRQYSEDFITSNFNLPENSPDLVPIEPSSLVMPIGLFYSGRSILTPGPGDLLVEKLYGALMLDVMPDYFAAKGIVSSAGYLFEQGAIEAVIAWYVATWFSASTTAAEKAADPDYTMLLAWQQALDMNYLSQSLDGFMTGLIQTKTTLQLAVADPTGFTDDQEFAETVAGYVGDENTHAPLPLNEFCPVRNGNLLLPALRLVDNFGQFVNLPVSELLTSEPLEEPDENMAYLAPRLAQPARLHLRWLSARNDVEEMNDVPVSSPVCGWMVPNLLDSSLVFYDNSGQALGSVTLDAVWQPAPGSEAAIYYLPNIENRHLRRVIEWLIGQGKEFIGDFLEAVENGTNNIHPETYAQHGALALLAGQPLAITRSRLELRLMDDPAVNQSWLSFLQDTARTGRDTASAQFVKFPVRLGEYEQMNDGLIGYWIDNGDKFADDVFYAPQTDSNDSDKIITHNESTFTVDITAADPPVYFTMLFDPRGKLHATSGILPVKEIDIPPAFYASTLQQMEISFLTAPLLTNGQQLNLPVPPVPGYDWSWVQRQSLNWQTISEIKPVSSSATFTTTQALLEGWMKLKASDMEIINPDTNI